MTWFRNWLDGVAPPGRHVVLVGFSGGAAFAGGLVLADPQRFTGTAVLYGTLPFDAGVPTVPGRLDGMRTFLAHGDDDHGTTGRPERAAGHRGPARGTHRDRPSDANA